jgi:peptide/nickel transport system substrate-binding protein
MIRKLHAAAAAALLLQLTGCNGSSGTDGRATASVAVPQPPDGVPAGTRPLPLPEKGKSYDNPQPRANVRDGGTLTLPIAELGPNFNTFNVDGNTGYNNFVLGWMSPILWNVSITGELAPNQDYLLSAELVSDNPETVKYTLNPKAKWNDGTPIDWTAFDATWKTQRGDAQYNPASTDGYRSIASVVKGGADNEVIVTFKEPFYPFQLVFGSLEHPKNADPDFYKTGWVNNLHAELLTGPFTVEALAEDRLTLVRNPRWWGQPAKLERVVLRQMEDVATINAFQNGEIDSSTIDGGRATADAIEQIKNMANVQIRRGFSIYTSIYVLGQSSEFFKDPVAREAFLLGVNRALIVELRYQGMDWKEEAPGSILMYPWQSGYHDAIPDLRYDPAKAKELLDAAGWKVGDDGYRHKDGKLAEFNYVDFGDQPVFAAMDRAQQKMARDIGLKMNIDIRKSADFSKTLHDGSFDIVAMSFGGGSPFGYVYACQIYCSDSESNFSRVGTKAIDETLNKISTLPDSQQAIAAFNGAETEALHLFGMFPLYNGFSLYAVKAGLANFGPAGFKTVNPEDVGWQKTPALGASGASQ